MLILITHGRTILGFDPVLSAEGINQMRKIKAKAFERFPQLRNFKMIAGVGKRHIQSLFILVPDAQYSTSDHFGVKESQSADGKHIYLSVEKKIPIQDLKKEMEKAVLETNNSIKQLFPLTENVAIIGGRITAVASGISIAESKSACVYEIQLINGKLSIKEIFSVD